MRIAAAILAAGSSSRMGQDKILLSIGGMTVLERTVTAFKSAGIDDITIVVSESVRGEAGRLAALYGCRVVEGGTSRGASVLNALEAMDCDIAMIHDAARCMVTPKIILDSAATAAREGSGVAAIPARDTLRTLEGSVIDRTNAMQVQTPQSFEHSRILAAYRRAAADGFEATDDFGVYQRMWGNASYSMGSIANQKLTYAEDLPLFAALCREVRTGYGEDTHRLEQGRKLILGGVEIPFELGLLGHSDADAAAHAATDAMLGAAALGDIGGMFPDSCEEFRGISSLLLLERAYAAVREAGYALVNMDVTIVAQKPRLAPHIPLMRERMAKALGCAAGCISIKATTPEHTGPEGNLECITARAVCTLKRH